MQLTCGAQIGWRHLKGCDWRLNRCIEITLRKNNLAQLFRKTLLIGSILSARPPSHPTSIRTMSPMTMPALTFALPPPARLFRGSFSTTTKHRHYAYRPTRLPITRRARMCGVPPDVSDEVPAPLAKPAPSGPLSGLIAWWKRVSAKGAGQKAAVLRNYGLAAVLSYGLFDAVTYSLSFLFALRAYLAAGKELTMSTLPQVR